MPQVQMVCCLALYSMPTQGCVWGGDDSLMTPPGLPAPLVPHHGAPMAPYGFLMVPLWFPYGAPPPLHIQQSNLQHMHLHVPVHMCAHVCAHCVCMCMWAPKKHEKLITLYEHMSNIVDMS